MRRLSFWAFAAFAFLGNCFAASITVDGAGLRELRGAISGTPVPAGSKVLVGYFSGLTDAQIVSSQANPAFLQSKFIPFGLGGAVGQGTGGAAGYFTFVTTATVEMPQPTFAAPSLPNNRQLYIWTFDSDRSPLEATMQAIFTSNTAAWSFPTTDDGLTDRIVSPDDLVLMLVGNVDSNALYLHAIPEPAPCTLLAIAAAGLLGLRPIRTQSASA